MAEELIIISILKAYGFDILKRCNEKLKVTVN